MKTHASFYWHGSFIIIGNMKNILISFFVIAALFFVTGCTASSSSTQLTPSPAEANPTYTSGNVETAYPSTIITEAYSNIETAYPSTDQNYPTPLPAGVLPTAPQEAPVPDPGKASISGVLYSHTINQVVVGTGFYLLPAVGPEKKDVPSIIVAPDPSKGDIISYSDNNGDISINDIPPGNYYLVVWAPMNWSIAQTSEQDTTPRLLELNAGSRVPLGVIYISWP
jgi:hypothetical protein